MGNILILQDIHTKPNIIVSTYMGNDPLWSLSYEWWFYMIFYLLILSKRRYNIKRIVAIVIIFAGVSYLIFPFFLNRIFFYFAIWWVGVELAIAYKNSKIINIKSLHFTFSLIFFCIIIICCVNVFLHKHDQKFFSLGFSPYLELQHFGFSAFALISALIWSKYDWKGFQKIFGYFGRVSPITYTLYILHWPLLINREYLSFINNNILQFSIALIITIFCSYLLELVIYSPLRNWFFSKAYKRKESIPVTSSY